MHSHKSMNCLIRIRIEMHSSVHRLNVIMNKLDTVLSFSEKSPGKDEVLYKYN